MKYDTYLSPSTYFVALIVWLHQPIVLAGPETSMARRWEASPPKLISRLNLDRTSEMQDKSNYVSISEMPTK